MDVSFVRIRHVVAHAVVHVNKFAVDPDFDAVVATAAEYRISCVNRFQFRIGVANAPIVLTDGVN